MAKHSQGTKPGIIWGVIILALLIGGVLLWRLNPFSIIASSAENALSELYIGESIYDGDSRTLAFDKYTIAYSWCSPTYDNNNGTWATNSGDYNFMLNSVTYDSQPLSLVGVTPYYDAVQNKVVIPEEAPRCSKWPNSQASGAGNLDGFYLYDGTIINSQVDPTVFDFKVRLSGSKKSNDGHNYLTARVVPHVNPSLIVKKGVVQGDSFIVTLNNSDKPYRATVEVVYLINGSEATQMFDEVLNLSEGSHTITFSTNGFTVATVKSSVYYKLQNWNGTWINVHTENLPDVVLIAPPATTTTTIPTNGSNGNQTNTTTTTGATTTSVASPGDNQTSTLVLAGVGGAIVLVLVFVFAMLGRKKGKKR